MAKKKQTAGERIASTVAKQIIDWHTSYKAGDEHVSALARRINAAIKRAVKDVQGKTAKECSSMYFDARGVHHFEEMLRKKYGVRL